MTEPTEVTPEDFVEDKAVIGRSPDGMIFAALPPVIFGVTYLLLSNNHLHLSCNFVNSMAYFMFDKRVVDAGIASEKMIGLFVDSLKKHHNIEVLEERMWKRGTPDTFDGLYYAEFHPLELAAVGEIMKDYEAAQRIDGAAPPVIESVVALWLGASEKFVNEQERLAAATSQEGVA